MLLMKRFHKSLIYIVVLFISINFIRAQTIRFENPDYPYSKIIFAGHYADGIYKLNDVTTDLKGFTVIFNDSLKTGIYYLILQDSTSIEILFDSDFPGKINITKLANSGNYSISGPKPTLLYHNYTKTLKNLDFPTVIDSEHVIEETIQNDNSSFVSTYLKAHKNVKVPKYSSPVEVTNKDSAAWNYRLNYYQEHFLDNIDLADERLINSPIYTDLINEYLNKISKQEPLALKEAIKKIIDKSSCNITTQKFLVNYLLDKYGKRKGNPVSEYVYLYIIKDYFLYSGYKWLDNKQVNSLTDEYSRLYPTSLYQTAPNIKGNTPKGIPGELNDVSHRYTILYFYDYDCPVCQHYIPKLKWINTVYDYLDVSVFAVCLGESEEKWKRYISRNDISDWDNIYDLATQGDVSSTYNLRYTPTLFVLDKEKKIISKHINVKQLEEFFYELALNRNKKP